MSNNLNLLKYISEIITINLASMFYFNYNLLCSNIEIIEFHILYCSNDVKPDVLNVLNYIF